MIHVCLSNLLLPRLIHVCLESSRIHYYLEIENTRTQEYVFKKKQDIRKTTLCSIQLFFCARTGWIPPCTRSILPRINGCGRYSGLCWTWNGSPKRSSWTFNSCNNRSNSPRTLPTFRCLRFITSIFCCDAATWNIRMRSPLVTNDSEPTNNGTRCTFKENLWMHVFGWRSVIWTKPFWQPYTTHALNSSPM